MDNTETTQGDGETRARSAFADRVKVSVRKRQPKPDEATEATTISEEQSDGS